jgi:cytochrome c biogenesis protein CcdA
MDDFLVGANEIRYNLNDKIEEYLSFGGNKFPLEDGSSMAFEDTKAENLPGSPTIWFVNTNNPQIPTLLMMISAAAVDSVNPCEFAILVILLSSITASEGRRKALKAGLAFISAVFVMYLLMGIGILQITRTFTFLGVSFYFRKIVGIFALIVGALNIKDYFWEDAQGVLSSMPMSWRPRVQKLLDNITSTPGALLSGILVSFFLLPCTSGPYFIVLSLLDFESTRLLATALLLLYNVIFILPMIGIVLAVYFGLTTTAKAAHWRHKRLGLLHLIAGVVMMGMGIWMLFFYG